MLLGSGAAVNPFWAKLAKAPLTSTMAAAFYIVIYLSDLGPRRAYSASQRLISSTADRQEIR